MKRRRSLLLCIAILAIVGSIWSYVLITAPPQETLDQREHDVASQLKCLVCQGESVADSPALLSQQMRAIIRQQLQSGKSDQEVSRVMETVSCGLLPGRASHSWPGLYRLACCLEGRSCSSSSCAGGLPRQTPRHQGTALLLSKGWMRASWRNTGSRSKKNCRKLSLISSLATWPRVIIALCMNDTCAVRSWQRNPTMNTSRNWTRRLKSGCAR